MLLTFDQILIYVKFRLKFTYVSVEFYDLSLQLMFS